MNSRQTKMITLGAVASAHGVRGHFKVKSFTARPDALIDYGPLQTLDGRQLSLKIVGHAKGLLICKADEVSDRTEAQQLKGCELQIARTALPETGEDELYHTDLIGCDVIDEDAVLRGTLTGLFDFGAGEVADIQLSGKKETIMLPFIAPFLINLDIDSRKIQMMFSVLDSDNNKYREGAE